MAHWRQETTARLGRSSTMTGAASNGAPAPRSAPTTVAWAGAPPRSVVSMWEALARWIDDDDLLGGGGSILG
jgi:hypothetical protein